jgi:uncharacterized protein (TIGR04255 family)
MAERAEIGPNYERPPVVETVLGVQFDRLVKLKNAHLGAFWKTLDNVEWPTVADAPPLPPQFEQFDPVDAWGRGVQVRLTQDPSSRLQIRNKDGNRMLQLQNGRLHFNWLGKGGDSYPRYEKVREEFIPLLEDFEQFVATEDLGTFQPNQWEITYVNHIPQGTVWDSPADWGFFRPLSPLPSIANIIEGESFGGQWHFLIPPRLGRLHIEWQHERIPSEGEGETTNELIRLTLTARGPVGKSGVPTVLEGLDLGRVTIVNSFQQLMSDEKANTYWGLKHADQ